jgi:hypothetical protein
VAREAHHVAQLLRGFRAEGPAAVVVVGIVPLKPFITATDLDVGGVGEIYGWGYGFALAGIGLLTGFIVFIKKLFKVFFVLFYYFNIVLIVGNHLYISF